MQASSAPDYLSLSEVSLPKKCEPDVKNHPATASSVLSTGSERADSSAAAVALANTPFGLFVGLVRVRGPGEGAFAEIA
jgi:hypothetical protein